MDFEDGLDWDDFIIIGPMSEEIAEEERQRRKLERENIPIVEDEENFKMDP